jgi:hypothetical protein
MALLSRLLLQQRPDETIREATASLAWIPRSNDGDPYIYHSFEGQRTSLDTWAASYMGLRACDRNHVPQPNPRASAHIQCSLDLGGCGAAKHGLCSSRGSLLLLLLLILGTPRYQEQQRPRVLRSPAAASPSAGLTFRHLPRGPAVDIPFADDFACYAGLRKGRVALCSILRVDLSSAPMLLHDLSNTQLE